MLKIVEGATLRGTYYDASYSDGPLSCPNAIILKLMTQAPFSSVT